MPGENYSEVKNDKCLCGSGVYVIIGVDKGGKREDRYIVLIKERCGPCY